MFPYMRLHRILLPLLTCIAIAQAAQNDSQGFSAVNAVIEQAIAEKQIPGAVLVVGQGGKVVYRKAYGMRSLEPTREPMTEDTVFDIASLTKPVVTATCIMELLRRGKLRLNDPVAAYIPEFGRNGKHEITVRQLLTHFSGLREDLDLTESWMGRDGAFQAIAEEHTLNPPGSTFVYSDINFEILGFLVEKLAGMPLDQFAQQVVFAPLKMHHTRYLPPGEWTPTIAPTEANEQGQMLRGVVHDPTARRMGGVAGHAGIFATADDLALFAQAMLDRKGILTPALIDKMTTPQQPPWATVLRGLGWDIDSPFATNRGELLPVGSFGHTGFTGTTMWVDPYTKIYFILLTNGLHPRASDPWAKVSLRTKVANAITGTLGAMLDARAHAIWARITGYNAAAAAARRPIERNGKVRNGIDVLTARGFGILRGKRVGLLTNQTGLDMYGERTIDRLYSAASVKLVAIFGPEHGVAGDKDSPDVKDGKDRRTGVPVYSLYGASDESRRPSEKVLGDLDVIVVDIQDLGVRFYTYVSTLLNVMEMAAKHRVELVVLDRPNPVSGVFVQGPVSDTDRSFLNPFPLPVRHGMTIGELARLFAAEQSLMLPLTVIPMEGWERGDWFDSTGQLWVNPSPNMRNLTEATLYAGVAMIEFSNVSVGRGTDTPFELVGAPWITAARARELTEFLNARRIAGVRFVPTTFVPTTSNHAGLLCGGFNIIVTDRNQLDAPELGLELASALRQLFPQDYKLQRTAALVSHRQTMKLLEAGADPRRIADEWREELERFLAIRLKYLLYP